MVATARRLEAVSSTELRTREVAQRLLALAFAGEELPVEAALRNEQAWIAALRTTSSEVAITDTGIALALGSVAAALTAANLLGRGPSMTFEGLLSRDTPASCTGWAGYLPFADGWISIALGGAEESELIRRCLSVHTDKDPAGIAAALQEWGVASFPVVPVPAGATRVPSARQPLEMLLAESGPHASRGLSGVRVLDCGQLVSAPWAAALLASWGADLVAVSHPRRAAMRRYGPPPLELDLCSEEDQRCFAGLCRKADVVIDNFRDRVWTNLGLDPLQLGARLHVRLPAFPRHDPRCDLKVYGFQLEGLFGIGHVPAPRHRHPVDAPQWALLDHSVGFVAAAQCVIALLRDERGRLELSHLDLLEAAT
jgi:hypothetical protein